MTDARIQRWRTLVLLYPVLDARYGSGLARRRARRVMTREERAAVSSVVERLPATVEDWSSGLATLEPFDIVEMRRPIGSLSSSGGGRWWVGPREVRPELADIAAAGAAYDSVIALWPCDPDVPQCGWGCTIGPGEATFGAGFSSISTDHWRTLLTDPDPEQGYVHEWLHQVESVYRALGISEGDLPPLHDAGAFTSARPVSEAPFGRTYAEYHDGGARTWSPWYRDWMTGQLRPAAGVEAASGHEIDAGAAEAASMARTEAAATDRLVAGAECTSGDGLVAGAEASAGESTANPRPIGLTAERWAIRGTTKA